MPDAEDEIRRDSDLILSDLEELKKLERAKRTEPIDSPRFRALAKRIEAISRRVFGRASDEAARSEQAQQDEDHRTIKDIERPSGTDDQEGGN
jgi:hypothetical protein